MKQRFLSLSALRLLSLTADIDLAVLERQQGVARQSVSETRDRRVEIVVGTLTMSICCPRVILPSDCSTLIPAVASLTARASETGRVLPFAQ